MAEPVSGLSLAQQRAREAIRQGVAPAEPAAPVPPEETPAAEDKSGAAVVRTSALQAKLERLRRRREP